MVGSIGARRPSGCGTAGGQARWQGVGDERAQVQEAGAGSGGQDRRIAELEAEELGLEGMDWGTIIVGVCEADCQPRGVDEGQAGYTEEWAGVQWEELVTARK